MTSDGNVKITSPSQGTALGASHALPFCLVIDDEPAICHTIIRILESIGMETAAFSNASRVTPAIFEKSPFLIFLDLSLEGSDAVEAIRELAVREFKGAVQLISGMPADVLEGIKEIGERYGLRMLPVLRKPFRIDRIKELALAELNASQHDNVVKALGQTDKFSETRIKHTCDLAEALSNGWMELWYQPKIDLKNGCIVGAEGLARARHPIHGIMTPATFLPHATSDALLKLTEFGLITVLNDLPSISGYKNEFKLSINISVEALQSLPLPVLIRQYGFKGAGTQLILEITEDQFVRDVPLAREVAAQLSIYGITLSLDDFGAGYSSLARLKDLPFGELKLDRSFVTNCANDTDKNTLCQTAINLAHQFNSIAVAEGIESLDDVKALCEMGCDMGQGFLFCEAVPKEVFSTMMLHQSVVGSAPWLNSIDPLPQSVKR